MACMWRHSLQGGRWPDSRLIVGPEGQYTCVEVAEKVLNYSRCNTTQLQCCEGHSNYDCKTVTTERHFKTLFSHT